MSSRPRLPKQKCCISDSRCKRCPIRMLREGTMPDGYTVKKRKLIQTGELAAKSTKKSKRRGKKGRREKVRPLAA